MEEFCQSFAANLLSDSSVKDFDLATIDRAANCSDSIPIGTGLIAQTAQEFRALGRQGERHRNLCHVEQSETSLIIAIVAQRRRYSEILRFAQNDNEACE